MITLMDSIDATKDLNVGVKTASASAAAALFRIFLMPVVSYVFVYQCEEEMFFYYCYEMIDLILLSHGGG